MVNKSSFDIKSSTLRHTKIRLKNPDLKIFFSQMQTIALKAPKLFAKACIILDFSLISHHLFLPKELEMLREGLLQQGANLIGIENTSSEQKNAAIQVNIPLIYPQAALSPKTPSTENNTTLTLQRVRTGSNIVSQGDIVVLGDCAYGAVLNADGHVYIYGKLEGKVHWAIKNPNAHLICQHFDPEVISIAGINFTQDQIPTQYRKKHIICSLNPSDNSLLIKRLSTSDALHGHF